MDDQISWLTQKARKNLVTMEKEIPLIQFIEAWVHKGWKKAEQKPLINFRGKFSPHKIWGHSVCESSIDRVNYFFACFKAENSWTFADEDSSMKIIRVSTGGNGEIVLSFLKE